ncbi:MAG: type II toxin-antitoxin system RelE/ParE family toxin [Gemmataceae bacterium]|nr:type II toxin-antitoxin system RelE/ParE family toxin [Gemmataceae bacterium]
MSAAVIYLPEAQADVDAAYTGYEQRQTGLGERFLEQLRRRVGAINDNPEMYAVLRDEVRAAPLRRFPYVVYYRFEAGTVFILAVLNGRRDPQVAMSRI